MACRILIVEDEFLIASEIELVISDMGHEPVGIAPDQRSALAMTTAAPVDIALVDLNLRDGPTGKTIGRILAQTHGVTVVFMTANPAQLGGGVPGTIGVLPKPASETELRGVVEYAVARHRKSDAERPPRRLQLFTWSGGGGANLAT